MSDFQKSVIAPEIIAAHLAAAANLSDPALVESIAAQPRLIELLWFLQWASLQPGSLEKFAHDTIQKFPARFGPAMLQDEKTRLTTHERAELWKKFDSAGHARRLVCSDSWWDEEAGPKRNYNYFHEHGALEISPAEERRMHAALAKLPLSQFHAVYLQAAHDNLAERLRAICEKPGKYLPGAKWSNLHFFDPHPPEEIWWTDDLIALLFAAMDAHAMRELAAVAQTEVSIAALEALDYAWAGKVLVQIEGSSRFGKTTAVRAWAQAHPGKVRLVSTPGTNYDRDLFKAVAEALGVQFAFNKNFSGLRLKDKVETIIRHSGLMFIFDEGHFLLPQRILATTLPGRLNWLRTQIIDRKLPVCIVSTPQTMAHAVGKFTRATGYNFEQWLGRIAHTATLPEALGNQDLLAIARFYGPDLSLLQQKFVVAKAEQKESYIKAVENIISLARWIARRAGREKILLADLELAAAGRMRGQPAAPAIAPEEPPPAPRPIATRRGRAITPEAPALEMPAARNTTPADSEPAALTVNRNISPLTLA